MVKILINQVKVKVKKMGKKDKGAVRQIRVQGKKYLV